MLQPLAVRVFNGEFLQVTHFVSLSGLLGQMAVSLLLRVIKTTIPVVLGYPFVAKMQPLIDWKRMVLRVERKGLVFEIPALPPSNFFRMTSPVGAHAMEEAVFDLPFGLFGLEQVWPEGLGPPGGKPGTLADTRHPEAVTEVVEPTSEDKKALANLDEPKWKTKKRLRNSPRKAVEKLIENVDHTICGPDCMTEPVPQAILDLN